MIELGIAYFIIVNVVAFAMYGIDKQKAIKHKYRISEKALLLSAVVGGSIGAFIGMRIFRHKTKHMKFVIGVPTIIILQVLLAIGIAYIMR